MAVDSLAYPIINGYRYSWASLSFKFPKGLPEPGVKEISYKGTLDRGKVRGAGRRVLGYTRGNLDYDGSITMLADEYLNFVNRAGNDYMDMVFTVTVGYREGSRVHKVVITGCRLGEEDFSHSQSTDGLEVKLKLQFLYYDLDGIRHIPHSTAAA